MPSTWLLMMPFIALVVLVWVTAGLRAWNANGRRDSELLWMLAGPLGWARVCEAIGNVACWVCCVLFPVVIKPVLSLCHKRGWI